MFKLLRNLTFIAIGLIGLSAQATVYSWVDDNGNTHFSDTPIEGSQEVEVQIHSAGASMVRDQTGKNKSQSQQNEKKGPPSNSNGSEQGNQEMPIMGDGDMPPPPPSEE